MKQRKLLNGTTARELFSEVYVQVHTKCSDKWVAVDLETGDVWHNKNFQWERHKGILVIKDGRVLMTENGEAYNKERKTNGKKDNVRARPNRRRRAQHHKRQSPR